MGIGIEAVVPNHDLALDAYIRRLIEAGYGKRIMFGSDNMAWPESIRLAVESIESADFLTPEQKRDIFYNNAARFFRLE
ncbi:MAG: amidohydrolase family protein [Candidatus Aminicenantales bacterium]